MDELANLTLKNVSTIYAFFLAMTIYPDIQARAQAELDPVVGNDRLPIFDDRDSLPYINAICKEVCYRSTQCASTHIHHGIHLILETNSSPACFLAGRHL